MPVIRANIDDRLCDVTHLIEYSMGHNGGSNTASTLNGGFEP